MAEPNKEDELLPGTEPYEGSVDHEAPTIPPSGEGAAPSDPHGVIRYFGDYELLSESL
ncbi:MAG: hypothetical protein HY000_05265 [Planctomycetes bacterium]|nr:hypothetical protein [Planctomycetota bacterium]